MMPVTRKEGRQSCVTKTWMVGLLNGLGKYGLSLVTEHWSHKPSNSPSIMDIFTLNGVSDDHLHKLNWCRIHIRVHHVGDILTVDGKH